MKPRKKANLDNEEFFLNLVNSGHLQISEIGEVYNTKTGNTIGSENNRGYITIGFKDGKKVRSILVHRLVYLIHNEELDPYLEINHIDGNKTNNHISNLEAITLKENIRHAYKIGLYENAKKIWAEKYKGHKGSSSKLSRSQVEDIRRKYKKGGVTMQKLADSYGVNKSNIGRIIRNETYNYLNPTPKQ